MGAVCGRRMAAWHNAGSSSIPSSASPRPSALATSSGVRRVITTSKPLRRCAGPRLLVKQMPSRRSQVLGQPCRPRFSTTAPSAPRHAMGSGGDQARRPSLTRWSTISQELWLRGSRTVRRASTSRVVLFSRRMHWTRASEHPRPCSMDTKGKLGQNAGFASSKTRNFWPPPSLSKSPSALWPS